MSHEIQIVNKGVEQSSTVGLSTGRLPVPCPRIPISVRPATMEDLSFIDGLQKIHTKMVGWMPTKAIEGKIRLGHVLIAEEVETADGADNADKKELDLHSSALSAKSAVSRLGYCMGNDQYFKRDDVGIIYQMNVLPGKQRGFVGATLLKAMFDRAAYGCKLFCCWCAQDIAANRFWESLGFVALAFRAGSREKGRVHIFWQRRIREGDTTTPWWFPSQTSSGSIREDRLVLPIPPGVHWSDAMPKVLPGVLPALSGVEGPGQQLPVVSGQLPVAQKKKATGEKITGKMPVVQQTQTAARSLGGWSFTPPPPAKPAAKEKAPREKRKATKNDPKLIAAARELRDRWLERVNDDPMALESHGKYEVCRTLPSAVESALPALPVPVIPSAAIPRAKRRRLSVAA